MERIETNLFSDVDFPGAAHDLLANIRRGFWNSDGCFAKEKLIGNAKAFLWPYGGYAEAVAAQYLTYPDCAQAKQIYLETLAGIRPYQVCREDGLLAYAAANGGAGDVYFDDNAWLVILYMNAYRALGEDKWLDLAERTLEFCYSGWDEKLGGGIYWQENHKNGKNTCINAPVAKVSAEMYQLTGKTQYLDWAKRIYAWTKAHLMDPADGLYFDNVNLEGRVDPTKYSYNTGCMIGAGAHLYEITGEDAYLNDAKRSAAAALDGGFGKVMENGYYRFDRAVPWFNTWLLDGYMALYPHDPNDAYIHSFASAAAYALRQKTASGFIPADWHSADYPDESVHILDQSGTVRILYDVALWAKQYDRHF